VKLDPAIVVAENEKAQKKYAALKHDAASILFSFEAQGYLAACVETHGLSKEEAAGKIADLVMMWLRTNE